MANTTVKSTLEFALPHDGSVKPKEYPLGVLLLHGFTSSAKTVDGLTPYLTRFGLPYARPILKGHGETPAALKGVTHTDWMRDAEAALLSLLTSCHQAVIVGLSMGGLLAIELGIRHRKRVRGVVLVAPALRFANPLAPFAHYLQHLLPYFPSPSSFHDRQCKKEGGNYSYFPVDAFVSLYELSKIIEQKLPQFDRPLVILQHRAKQSTDPKGAEIIYQKVASAQKSLLWFEHSGHEMMQDLEKEEVFKTIVTAIQTWRNDRA